LLTGTGGKVIGGIGYSWSAEQVIEYCTSISLEIDAKLSKYIDVARQEPGKILVHNHLQIVSTDQQSGVNGFRFWLDDIGEPNREVCTCGWRPDLGEHYHVKSNWDKAQGQEAA
jgi:hypothetical protein